MKITCEATWFSIAYLLVTRCVSRGTVSFLGQNGTFVGTLASPMGAGAHGQPGIRLPCARLPLLALLHYCVVMRPILLTFSSVNQTLPSGPTVMPSGLLLAVGGPNPEKLPLGVMRPMTFPISSVNQRLPPGPLVMLQGAQVRYFPQVPGRRNSVKLPPVVMRPILFPFYRISSQQSQGFQPPEAASGLHGPSFRHFSHATRGGSLACKICSTRCFSSSERK